MSNPLIWIMTSKSESSQSLYLVSWWAGTVPKPGRWTSRSGCGPAGPSGSRSICSPCRAQCDFRRPGCAPAAPSTAAPARRRCTSAVAPRTRLTGRHGNFITNHFLDLFGICFAVILEWCHSLLFSKAPHQHTAKAPLTFISRPII